MDSKQIEQFMQETWDKATYGQHMEKDHGYEILNLRQYSEEEWNKLQESKK